MKRSYADMSSGSVVEVQPSKRASVPTLEDNSMTIEDSGDIPVQRTISSVTVEKRWKHPTFLLEKSLQGIKSWDKRTRMEAFSDIKSALPFNYLPIHERQESIKNTYITVSKCLYTEADEIVKQRIIECLSLFAQFISIDANIIIEDLINQFQASSNPVKASLLRALQIITQCKSPSNILIQTIEDICLEQLQSRKVIVRKQALSLLCRVAESPKLQEIVSRSCELDPDPRVRCAAFQGILTMHQRSVLLDIKLYKRAVEGMTDDNEQVKLCAVELMWILCNLHPFHVFTIKGGEKTRLVDDGFIRICNMVNDISFHVRAKASRLLGGIRNVSTQYLLQAFSKELFGRGNKMTLSRTKSNDVSAAGDFDLTQCADVNVLDSGAGAFVHGLEDEYYQVRMATIDSICELSCGSPEFARIAVEFLVDMFNDEINAVRVNSIHSLRKISSHIQLNEEQLQIALSALEDVTKRLRFAMQQLLMTVRMSNIQSVHISIQGLLNNIKKYPEDKENIFQALQGIGANHSHFMEYIVENLLNIDLNFAQMEANVNDVFYIAKLIAVCNACSVNPHILALLPKNTERHYRYLKDKYPKYFPSALPFREVLLPSVEGEQSVINSMDSSVDLGEFFTSTWELILSLHEKNESFDSIVQKIEGFSLSLDHISRTHGHLASLVDFYSLLHRALSLMFQAQYHQLKEETGSIAPELLKLSYQIEQILVGLDNRDILELHMLRLFSHTVAVVGSLSNQGETDLPNAIDIQQNKNSIQSLYKRIMITNKFCETRNITKPDRLVQLSELIAKFSNSTGSDMTPKLLDLLHSYRIHPFVVKNQVKTVTGSIVAPQPNSEHPKKFNPSVPLIIGVKAEIKNLMNTRGLMILCTYPDHKEQLFPVLEKYITPITRSLFEINCRVSVESSHPRGWTEQSSISLQLVRTFDTDLPEYDDNIIGHTSASSYILFGQPVLYHIFPKRDYFPSKKHSNKHK